MSKLKIAILSFFIIALPFIYFDGTLDPVHTLRFLTFSFVVLILNLLGLKNKSRVKSNTIILLFFGIFIMGFISMVFNDQCFSESVYYVCKTSIFLIFILNIVELITDENSKIKLSYSITIFGLLVSLIYFTQLIIRYQEIDDVIINKLAGTMANKNLLASALFLTIPFNIANLLNGNKAIKIISTITQVIIIIVFFIVFSKATLLALLVLIFSAFIYFFCTKKYVEIYLTSFIALTILSFATIVTLKTSYEKKTLVNTDKTTKIEEKIFANALSSGARLQLYNNTLSLIKSNPILGVGPGNWKIKHGQFSLKGSIGETGQKLVQRPHNDFLWIAAESGILAGVLYFLVFIISLFKLINQRQIIDKKRLIFNASIFGTVLGYLLISALDFPFERVPHNILFIIILGFIISNDPPTTNKSIDFKYLKPIIILGLSFSIFIGYTRHVGEIHSTKAKALKGKNVWHRVIKEIDKAYDPNFYELDRSGTPLHWYRGVANFSMGKQELAFKDFLYAHKLNPNHLHVLNNLATIYELKGDRKNAIYYYSRALEISPKFEESAVNFAAVLFNERKIQQSLDVLLRCDLLTLNDEKKYYKYLNIITIFLIDDYLASNNVNNLTRKKIIKLRKKLRLLNNFKRKDAKKIMQDLYQLRKLNNQDYLYLYLNNYED